MSFGNTNKGSFYLVFPHRVVSSLIYPVPWWWIFWLILMFSFFYQNYDRKSYCMEILWIFYVGNFYDRKFYVFMCNLVQSSFNPWRTNFQEQNCWLKVLCWETEHTNGKWHDHCHIKLELWATTCSNQPRKPNNNLCHCWQKMVRTWFITDNFPIFAPAYNLGPIREI